MTSVFGVKHQAKIASDEDIFFIEVDKKIEELLNKSIVDNETDIEWLQSNYYSKNNYFKKIE